MILEHNSKLSHEIDVTPGSSTTYDHHVTSEPQHVRENQNGETNDTEHNDRRKHDYKPSRENIKSDYNNKEKKFKEDNLRTSINNKNSYILGDSIVKHVKNGN